MVRSLKNPKKAKRKNKVHKVFHEGCVNMIRAMTQKPHICASWGDTGHVQIWDVSSHLNAMAEFETNISKDATTIINQPPLVKFTGHKDEGYAIDWSPLVPGRLVSGDCKNCIYLWEPASDSTWNVDNKPFVGHTASVEDLQWSPTEPFVFASGSVDKTIAIWDTRIGKSPATSIKAHETDVNVISWNSEASTGCTPSDQSSRRIQAFLDLPASERTFHSEGSHSVTHSSTSAMSGYSKGSPAIILDDIDSFINVKKEGPQDVPKSSSFTPAPKTARATSSRKRKTSEPNPFEGLDSEQTLAKMLSLMTLGCQKVTEGFQQATQCHAELQSAALEKNHYIHSLQQDLDNLKGRIVATELRHAEEVAHLKDSTKHSIATLILQDRIRMAREAQDAGFDRSSWDVEGWEKRLEELGGQVAESSKKDVTTPMAPEDKGKAMVEAGEVSMVVSQGDDDVIEKV